MRDKADHEATAMMKAQFMSLWDGKQFVTNRVKMQNLSNHKISFDTQVKIIPRSTSSYMFFFFTNLPVVDTVLIL